MKVRIMREHPVGEHPVVIVGGGPIGIATALELAFHRVPSVILEQRAPGVHLPMRANLTNLRTMEHFRRWGIADKLRENDPISDEFERSTTWVTHLNGKLVRDFPRAFDFSEPTPLGSDRPEWAPNTAIDKTMQDAAAAKSEIDFRFGCSVIDFDQDADGVNVRYRDTANVEHWVRGKYLLAADGSRSTVRKSLGIRMEGVADVVAGSIWHVEAPGMIARSTVGKSSFVWFINEHRDSLLFIVQDSEKERYMFMLVPATTGADPNSWEDTRKIILRNIGFDTPLTNLGGGAVSIHSLIVPRFNQGRVFLAGDAAHLISPMGGFGLNLGIGDAVDLGWKLAATIQGWGGERLLETYGFERSKVIRWILQECADNTAVLAPQLVEEGIDAEGPEGDAIRERVGQRIHETKTREFASWGAQLGYRYEGSPIVVPDGSTPPPLSMAVFTPSAFPGCRAPHVWLQDGRSLFDILGPDFTVLKLDSDADTTTIEQAARERGVPLVVVQPNHTGLAQLYEAKLAIVRPDQHIAWRGNRAPTDALALIDSIRGA
jgi:2-polyprenyl-6-methoxyphenol hydroxylase-like FAD-dependent oxidoreductase